MKAFACGWLITLPFIGSIKAALKLLSELLLQNRALKYQTKVSSDGDWKYIVPVKVNTVLRSLQSFWIDWPSQNYWLEFRAFCGAVPRFCAHALAFTTVWCSKPWLINETLLHQSQPDLTLRRLEHHLDVELRCWHYLSLAPWTADEGLLCSLQLGFQTREAPRGLLLIPSLFRPRHSGCAVPWKQQHYSLALCLSIDSTLNFSFTPRQYLHYYSLAADCEFFRSNLSFFATVHLKHQTIVSCCLIYLVVWINFPPF